MKRIRMFVGEIAINTHNYKSAVFSEVYRTLMGTRQLGPRTTRTETSRPVSEDKSAHKRGLVGPYVKTTRTINNYCCLTYFFNKINGNHKDTV